MTDNGDDTPPDQPGPVAGVLAWFDTTFLGQCVDRILELQPFDRALAIASRAFVAIFPLAIVATSMSPAARSGGFAEGIIDRFDLEGDGAARVRQLFATPTEVRAGTTLLGILVLVFSVFSFARLLARTYEAAWRLPRSGVRGALRGLVWVAAIAGYVGFLMPLRTAVIDETGRIIGGAAVLTTTTLVWLFTPYVLLAGRIPYRSLLPTGVVTAVALGLASMASGVYMPEAIATAGARYGLVGVAFSLVSWLTGIGLALLVAAAVGAVAAERWVPPPAITRAPVTTDRMARTTDESP